MTRVARFALTGACWTAAVAILVAVPAAYGNVAILKWVRGELVILDPIALLISVAIALAAGMLIVIPLWVFDNDPE